MIINESKTTFKSNMELKSANFGIKNMSKIFDILQNKLYANKKQVIAQEYLSNARDASREAKSTRPVEVQVPTPFSLFLKIRDFGLGISEERMYDVFINYGASTKEDTNDQTGGFGLGAKSAFSYTNSFQITTYIDGIKTIYLAHVNERKEGKLSFIAQEETTEDNGIEISIPIKSEDVKDFAEYIQRACYFWQENERPIALNMELQFHDWKNSYQLGNLIQSSFCVNNNRYSYKKEFYLLIDGIIYPMDNLIKELDEKNNKVFSNLQSLFQLNNKESIFVCIGNGVVEVGASRERVEETDFTFKNLTPIILKNYLLAKKDFNEKYNFSSLKDACDRLLDIESIYRLSDFTVDGWKVVNYNPWAATSKELDSVNVKRMFLDKNNDLKLEKKGRYSSKIVKVDISHVKDSLVVHEHGVADNKLLMNKKIKQYMASKNAKNITVLSFSSEQKNDEINKIISDLNAISIGKLPYNKVEVEREKREKKKVAEGKVPVYLFNYNSKYQAELTLEEIKKYEKVIYLNFEEISSKKELYSLRDYFKDYLFVGGVKATIGVISGLTNAISFTQWYDELEMSKEDIDGLLGKTMYDFWDSTSTKNKLLQQIIKLEGVNSSIIREFKELALQYKDKKFNHNLPLCLISRIRNSEEYKKVLSKFDKYVKMVDKEYPLISLMNFKSITKSQEKELILYLNNKNN